MAGPWEKYSSSSGVKPWEKYRVDDGGNREFSRNPETDMGSLKEGFANKLKKQALGVQQIGSDIGRWASGESGDPYSDYRKAIEARRAELEKAGIKPWTKLGEMLMSGLEMAAIPAPEIVGAGALSRIGYNTGLGGVLGAIDPVDPSNPYARPMNAAQGAAIGGIMPEAMSAGARYIPKMGGGMMSMVSPKYAARRYINTEYPGLELPQEVGGLWGNAPPDGAMGPPTPPFYFAEGVKPTVGMVSENPALRQMETMQRLKPGTKLAFYERDLDNLTAIDRGIRSRAMGPEDEIAAMERLNLATSGKREHALKLANMAPTDDMTRNFSGGIQRILTEPGTRANLSARAVARDAQKTGLGIGHPEFPDGYPLGPTAQDIYQTRKNLGDALQKTGVNLDDKTLAVKSARRESVGLMDAIDQDLNGVTGDAWQKYLDAYVSGIRPIEEGKAFQSILDMARNAPYIPGTSTHQLTPYMLRKAASDITTKELGKTTRDILTPENRRFMDDAALALSATETAQKGPRTTIGSPTAEWGGMLVDEIANQALRGNPGATLAMDFVTALRTSRGSKLLNEALLDPDKMNSLLRIYHQGNAPTWFGDAAARAAGAVPDSIARRYWRK